MTYPRNRPHAFDSGAAGDREPSRERPTVGADRVVAGFWRTSVSRLPRRRRGTRGVDRVPSGGGWESPIRGRLADLLWRTVEERNDATLDELTAALIGRAQVETGRRSGVVRAMALLGSTRKTIAAAGRA